MKRLTMATDYFNPLASGPGPDDPGFEDYLYALGEGMIYHDGGSSFFTDNARKYLVGVMAFARGLAPDLQNFKTVCAILNARGAEQEMYLRAMNESLLNPGKDPDEITPEDLKEVDL